MQRIGVIDTHTGGEPTRVVLDAPFQLHGATLTAKRDEFAKRYDDYRRAIVCEPRGADTLVGALLLPPRRPEDAYGVIFFNNVGYLGMCGHGTMGVVAALQHAGLSAESSGRLETPVGAVAYSCDNGASVTVDNVPSYRFRAGVPVRLPSGQTVHGDIAWGGNWFFITDDHLLDLHRPDLERLLALSREIKSALSHQEVFGADGAEIDHIELTGPACDQSVADSRNFVLCPGGAYDRSPCGTGTSAKLACLAADGKLKAGQLYRQQGILGSVFTASFKHHKSVGSVAIVPQITGQAYVTGENTLLLDAADPYCMGTPDARS